MYGQKEQLCFEFWLGAHRMRERAQASQTAALSRSQRLAT